MATPACSSALQEKKKKLTSGTKEIKDFSVWDGHSRELPEPTITPRLSLISGDRGSPALQKPGDGEEEKPSQAKHTLN